MSCHIFYKKVLFDETKRAIGVKFERNGKMHYVYCRKEVIVSGGTIGSSQILMLSGVGPHNHLEELGVKKHKGDVHYEFKAFNYQIN